MTERLPGPPRAGVDLQGNVELIVSLARQRDFFWHALLEGQDRPDEFQVRRGTAHQLRLTVPGPSDVHAALDWLMDAITTADREWEAARMRQRELRTAVDRELEKWWEAR